MRAVGFWLFVAIRRSGLSARGGAVDARRQQTRAQSALPGPRPQSGSIGESASTGAFVGCAECEISHAQRGASGDRNGASEAIRDWRADLRHSMAYMPDGGAALRG